LSRRDRVLLYAPHFAEYSTRLAQAMGEHAEVLLMLDGRERRKMCEEDWFRAATANIRVIEFSVHRRIWEVIWAPLLILAGLLFRPTVLHVQEQADITSARVTAALSRWIPTVVTVHDPTPHTGNDSEFLAKGNILHRDRIRACADMFHVHGEFCRREFLAMDDSRPIIQTFHGVMHVPSAAQLAQPEPDVILFFGRMEAYKGLDVLLDAMDRLNGLGRGYRLVLAGRGSELNRLKARALATPGVTVVGRFLTPAEVVEQFQKATVAVLPYLDATQSGVAAAAIGNGRPIVSSSIGGLPDVILEGQNGLLAPAGNAGALAEALDRVLQNEDLRETLTAGSRAAQDRLAWSVAAKVVLDGYRDQLPRARR
jgi:glycosyltransferase involved in cell wall biosynthesis